jgi:FkbM family methyltransferase|tara:strand:+ start:246 stop:1061 length:816 start_codon:yes stop_codon:yes gene_type:complete
MFYNKILAQILGTKVPYFKGKDKIIRFLYPTDKYKNIYKGENFIINYFGKKYQGITSNYTDWGVYFYGGLEKALIGYIETEIKNFNYFLDIGSNSGSISLPFINRNNLKIICFEPHEYSFRKLLKNFKLNNAVKDHIFHKIALSNESGKNYIYFKNDNDENRGGATLDKLRNIKDVNKEEIITEKLDNLYKFKNEFIFIKIDVEGFEKKVIDGSINILKNNKILMYLETENLELLSQMERLNYKILNFNFSKNKLQFQKNFTPPHVLLKNF